MEVLHIGPMRVGPNFDTGCFVRAVKGALGDGALVDYVAICGPLTEAGRPEDFAQLSDVLTALVGAVVRGTGDTASKLRRVMVVPGPSDVATGLGEFAGFSRRLLSTEVAADGAVVRHLKHLTFVGVPYWNDSRMIDVPSLENAIASLRRIVAQPEWCLAYLKRTPTVLLSADSPFCASQRPSQAIIDQLREVANPGVDVAAHLIGGEVCRLWREAFTHHQHFTVAAGLASGPAGSFPVTMNKIVIAEVAREDVGTLGRTLGVVSLRTNGYGVRQADELVERQPVGPRPNRLVLDTFKRDLENLLADTQRRTAVVTGFPGAGKKSFANYLVGATTFLGAPVEGRHLSGIRWDATDLKPYLSKLSQAIDAFDPKSLLRTRTLPAPLLVIQAPPLPRAVPGDVTDQLFGLLADFLAGVESSKAYVVLFIPEIPERRAGEVAVMQLPRLPDGSAFTEFFEDRMARVPLRANEAESLTGRWVGYTDLLVNRASRAFERLGASDLVGDDVARSLVDETLGSAKARQHAELFRTHFDKGGAWPRVFRYLASEAARAWHQGRNPAVQLSRQSLLSTLTPAANPDLVRRAIGSLVDADVLEVAAGDQLKLALPFPFLVGNETVHYSVFIAYAGNEITSARALHDGLKRKEGPGVEIKLWLHPDNQDHTGEWGPLIIDHLRECRNLVVFYDGGPQSTADREVGVWLKHWRAASAAAGTSGFFPVCFRGRFPKVRPPGDSGLDEDYLSKVDRLRDTTWTSVDEAFTGYVFSKLVEDPPVTLNQGPTE